MDKQNIFEKLSGETFGENWNRLSKYEKQKIIGTSELCLEQINKYPNNEKENIKSLVITLTAFYLITGGELP